jgi:hypothetical protein
MQRKKCIPSGEGSLALDPLINLLCCPYAAPTATTEAPSDEATHHNDNNEQYDDKNDDTYQTNHLGLVATMTGTLTSFLVHNQQTPIGVP